MGGDGLPLESNEARLLNDRDGLSLLLEDELGPFEAGDFSPPLVADGDDPSLGEDLVADGEEALMLPDFVAEAPKPTPIPDDLRPGEGVERF